MLRIFLAKHFQFLSEFCQNLACSIASKNAVNSPFYHILLILDWCTAREIQEKSRIGWLLVLLENNFIPAICNDIRA